MTIKTTCRWCHGMFPEHELARCDTCRRRLCALCWRAPGHNCPECAHRIQAEQRAQASKERYKQ